METNGHVRPTAVRSIFEERVLEELRKRKTKTKEARTKEALKLLEEKEPSNRRS